MTFSDCCSACLADKEFLAQFTRLTGMRIGAVRTGMEAAIDAACGYDPDKSGMEAFCRFVFEFVWLPLVAERVQWNRRVSQ